MATPRFFVALLLAACASSACARTDTPSASSQVTTPPPAPSPQTQTSADEPVAIGDPSQDGPPSPSLLERGLVTTAERDAQIRALIGDEDYRLLLDTAALVTDTNTPGFVTMNVRGLNTIMEAALQQTPSGGLRVALLDDGQVRYYSNDAATTGALPAAFETWRSSFSDAPVHLMSAPGQPLLQARTPGE